MHTRVLVLIVAMTLVACSSSGGNADRAADPERRGESVSYFGTWEFISDRPGDPQLAITIDSAHAGEVFAHVVRYFVGNVEADPEIFGPMRGTMVDSVMRLESVPPDPRSPRIAVGMRWDGSSMTLLAYKLGDTDMISDERRWSVSSVDW